VRAAADHSRPWRALAAVLALAACTGTPAMDATGRATLDLSSAWDQRPWETGGAGGPGLQLTGRVVLPAERLGAGSVLVLEGAWWGVQATVNGVALSPATGGLAPVQLDVGPHLRAGENTFVITISPPPPGTPPLLTGGGLASGGGWRPDRPDLQVAPRLELRPAAHVDTVSLPLDAGQVAATARVTGAPEGARVRFTVALDGEQVASLGEAPVVAGVATAAATAWTLDDWRPGRPALYLAQAELLGPDGAVLDRLARRTGALDVSGDESGLRIAGEPLRLMAVRVTNHDRDLPGRFRALVAGGANSVEVHGELPRSTWLDQADELGLPAVVVPRCVGRTNKGNPTDAILAAQHAQDLRMVDHTAHHPSPVLWATEGQTANSQKKRPGPPKVLWTDGLLTDPLDRPVSQHDVKARVQRVGMPGPDGTPQDSCTAEGCAAAWLTEVTWRGPATAQMWSVMSARTQHALTEGGALGVVIPTPRPADQAGWAPAWAGVAEATGMAPAAPGPFRAASLVSLRGGPAGATVFVEAPGHPTLGTVLDAGGAGQVRLWHAGDAVVVLGERRLPLTLRAGAWEGWVETPAPVAVDLSGG
jgi:hypothetical protein